MVGLALFAALVALGCTEDVEVGASCVYASDCAEGLGCVGGRCGQVCHEHRDCPLDAECLRTASGTRCSLRDERCPCDEGLVCGNDGLCHSACGETCSDGVCASDGTCRRAGADAGPLDAGDAGTLAIPEHVACETSPVCGAGHVCVDHRGGGRACRVPCDAQEDCALEESVCHGFDDSTSPGAILACTIPCDPLSGAGCAEGEACDWLDGLGPGDAYVPHFECRRVLVAGTQGASCGATQEPTSCALGFHCQYDTEGAPYRCARWCRTGDPSGCEAAEDCLGFSPPRVVAGVSFGFCWPRSTP